MKLKGTKGFTLIELIIVLVIIGILAAVAMPRFANIQENAQINAIQGTVGNVRSAITIAKAENLVNQTNVATNYWPTLAEVQLSASSATLSAACPLDSIMPENPFVGDNSVVAATAVQADARTVVGGGAGYAYDQTRGIFYANSDTTLPSGTVVAENDF